MYICNVGGNLEGLTKESRRVAEDLGVNKCVQTLTKSNTKDTNRQNIRNSVQDKLWYKY